MSANPIYWGVWREDQSPNGDTTQTGYVDSVGETYSTSIDNSWGKRPSIGMINKPWVSAGAYLTVASLSSYFTTIRNHGQIPLLAWRTEAWGGLGALPSLSLTSIASGAHDAGFLTPFATAIAALNYPVVILLDEEMNGSWNAGWYDATGVNFIAMWQHVVSVFRNAGATNATWLWCANGVAPGGSLTNWWPGAAYVDWAGVDVFNTSYSSGSTWITFDQILHGDGSQWGDSWDALVALDTTGKVRYGVSSFGSEDRTQAGANNFAQSATWLTDALGTQIPHAAGAARDYSAIEFMLWFDQNQAAAAPVTVQQWNIGGYPIGTNTNRIAAAQGPSGIGSPYYLAGNKFTLPSGKGILHPYTLTVPSDSLSDAILSTSGLQSFWKMNDAPGSLTAADSSSNSRLLTQNGSVTFGATSTVPSSTNTAVSFPGLVNTWLDGGNLTSWSISTTGQLSGGIAFTVPNLPAPGTFYTLMSMAGSGSNYEWALRIQSDGSLEFISWSLAGATYSSARSAPSAISAGQFYYTIFTIDSTRAGSGSGDPKSRLYRWSTTDASPVVSTSTDFAASISHGAGTLQVGRRGDASQQMPSGGETAYAFITNTELTAVAAQTYLRAFESVACSSVFVGSITQTGATITWTTDQLSDSLVNYGLSTTYDKQTILDTTQHTSHSVSLTNLSPGATYHLQVVSHNTAGAIGKSVDTTFVTQGSTATTTFSWTTDTPASSQVEYGLTNSYGSFSTYDPLRVTNHSVVITTLTPGNTYHYRVEGRNTAGTLTLSTDRTVTLPNVGTVQATVTWTTDVPGSSQVEYGLTTSYGTITTYDRARVTNHSVVITGLSRGSTYHYHVLSRNTAGTLTTSPDQVINVPASISAPSTTAAITLSTPGVSLGSSVACVASTNIQTSANTFTPLVSRVRVSWVALEILPIAATSSSSSSLVNTTKVLAAASLFASVAQSTSVGNVVTISDTTTLSTTQKVTSASTAVLSATASLSSVPVVSRSVVFTSATLSTASGSIATKTTQSATSLLSVASLPAASVQCASNSVVQISRSVAGSLSTAASSQVVLTSTTITRNISIIATSQISQTLSNLIDVPAIAAASILNVSSLPTTSVQFSDSSAVQANGTVTGNASTAAVSQITATSTRVVSSISAVASSQITATAPSVVGSSTTAASSNVSTLLLGVITSSTTNANTLSTCSTNPNSITVCSASTNIQPFAQVLSNGTCQSSTNIVTISTIFISPIIFADTSNTFFIASTVTAIALSAFTSNTSSDFVGVPLTVGSGASMLAGQGIAGGAAAQALANQLSSRGSQQLGQINFSSNTALASTQLGTAGATAASSASVQTGSTISSPASCSTQTSLKVVVGPAASGTGSALTLVTGTFATSAITQLAANTIASTKQTVTTLALCSDSTSVLCTEVVSATSQLSAIVAAGTTQSTQPIAITAATASLSTQQATAGSSQTTAITTLSSTPVVLVTCACTTQATLSSSANQFIIAGALIVSSTSIITNAGLTSSLVCIGIANFSTQQSNANASQLTATTTTSNTQTLLVTCACNTQSSLNTTQLTVASALTTSSTSMVVNAGPTNSLLLTSTVNLSTQQIASLVFTGVSTASITTQVLVTNSATTSGTADITTQPNITIVSISTSSTVALAAQQSIGLDLVVLSAVSIVAQPILTSVFTSTSILSSAPVVRSSITLLATTTLSCQSQIFVQSTTTTIAALVAQFIVVYNGSATCNSTATIIVYCNVISKQRMPATTRILSVTQSFGVSTTLAKTNMLVVPYGLEFGECLLVASAQCYVALMFTLWHGTRSAVTKHDEAEAIPSQPKVRELSLASFP